MLEAIMLMVLKFSVFHSVYSLLAQREFERICKLTVPFDCLTRYSILNLSKIGQS